MQTKITLTQEGSLDTLIEAFGDIKEIKKLISFDNFSPLIADGMKKVISDGGVLRTLRKSTQNIRRVQAQRLDCSKTELKFLLARGITGRVMCLKWVTQWS